MSKFMFVILPFLGLISLSLGTEFLSIVHELGKPEVTPLGIEHVSGGRRVLTPEKELILFQSPVIHQILDIQDEGAKLSGLVALKLVLEDTCVPICRYIAYSLERLISEFEPNMIIHDEIMFAGATCAYHSKIAYAATSAVPPKVFHNAYGEQMSKVDEWGRNLDLPLQKEFDVEKGSR